MDISNMDFIKLSITEKIKNRVSYLEQLGMKQYSYCLKRVLRFIEDKSFELLDSNAQKLMEDECIVFVCNLVYITDKFLSFDTIKQTRLLISEYINYYSRMYLGNKRKLTDKDVKKLMSLFYTCCLIDPDTDGKNDIFDRKFLSYSDLNDFKIDIYRKSMVLIEQVNNVIEHGNIIEYEATYDIINDITYGSGVTFKRVTKHYVFNNSTGKFLKSNSNDKKAYDKEVEVLRELSSGY